MASEDQLELFASVDNDEFVTFEITTATADNVLINNIGKHEHVLLIGVDEDGARYFASHGNAPQWLFWLKRCEEFLMRNCY